MEKFDVIVVGGGPGGYLCAERAAQGGLKAAVVEKRWMGGTCLNEGCVPTKSLLYCAKQYAAARHGADYGVHAEQVAIDHAKVVQRKNQVVKTLVNGVKSTMRSHGISVYMAEAKVLGRNADGDFLVQAGDTQLAGKRLVVATGSVTAVPPVPGLKEGLESGFVVTNREILDLTDGQTVHITAERGTAATEAPAAPAEPDSPTAVPPTTDEPDTSDDAGIPSTVYVTPTGKRYHYDPDCAGKNATPATLHEAQSRGLTPCQKCAA